MVEAIVSGISLGFVLALLLGPVFFMLINTSIKKGFTPAAYLAVGVMLSDALYIVIAYFSSTALKLIQTNKELIGLGGGLLLIIFGLVTILKKPVMEGDQLELPDDSKTYLIDTGKGFMMNMLNPFVLIFWVGVSTTLTVKDHFTPMHTYLFFGCALGTVLGTDLLKAFLAVKLKKIIKPSFLMWLNRISGLGLMIFGIRMIWMLFVK
jgi:threonine/homoserine/homoserine lactone efflux protein